MITMESNENQDLIEPKKVEVGKSEQIPSDKQIDPTHPIEIENISNTGINEENKNPPEKVKEPIIPYKVDDSYKNRLKAALEKNKKIRPKTILEEETIDRTLVDGILIQMEQESLKKLNYEKTNALKLEKDSAEEMAKYKESSLNGKTLLQDPLALLYDAKKLYIDQFYKISDFFVLCPLYYNYRISVKYEEEGDAYFLFQTNEISPIWDHTFCQNQSRSIAINIDNFIVNDGSSVDKKGEEKLTQTFLYIRKKFRCAVSCFCGCCTRPIFNVESPVDKFGYIVELRTIGDPILQVFDSNDDLIYIISCKGCTCGYCCADMFCGNPKCASCEFFIFDDKKNTVLGTIRKNHRSGKRMAPDYDQLELDFPEQCSCQNKVLLLTSALVIEYLYYQNNLNCKRLFGNPEVKQSIY